MRSVVFLLPLLLAAPAAAQTRPDPFAAFPRTGVTVGEAHRYENDRLRARAQEQSDFAWRGRVEADARLRDLQTARQPAVPYQESYTAPSLEAQRARWERETTRRESVQQGVGQIDDWLYRREP
jgi:hypothetical protein